MLQAGTPHSAPRGADAIQLQFKDFVKKGDVVTFTLNTAAKAIRQVRVDTYMNDEGKEKVALAVDFQTLPDGTNCAASKSLDATAKKIVVKVTAGDYQKLAQ